MEPPKYDENEPPYVYIKKVEEYLSSLKKEKYTKVMTFVNKLGEQYNKRFKSLCDFKNVSYMTDHSINKKILKEDGKKVAKKLNIEFDFDNLTKTSLFDFLALLTKTINYSIVKKVLPEKTTYTIIDKPPKTNVYKKA